ncbi:hypothetical protein ACFLZE_02395, partial [Thermodesulfobacteriota bacterium]
DYHLSDKFYDLIVDTRKAISDVEDGPEGSDTDGKASLRLLEAVKALATHVEKERAFDKVNDMGSVGIETFIEIIQKANKAIQEAENGLKVSE